MRTEKNVTSHTAQYPQRKLPIVHDRNKHRLGYMHTNMQSIHSAAHNNSDSNITSKNITSICVHAAAGSG